MVGARVLGEEAATVGPCRPGLEDLGPWGRDTGDIVVHKNNKVGSGSYFHHFKKTKGKCIPVKKTEISSCLGLPPRSPQQTPSLHMPILNQV